MMKKTMVAFLAMAMILALFCSQALAVTGDITVRETNVYSDAEMKNPVGKLPAYTSVLVRAYDSIADIYVDGKICYVNPSDLLRKDASSNYYATLKKGTRIYQCPASNANSRKLKKSGTVKLCLVNGDWALVRSTGKTGVYAFVKISKLSDIRTKK